ncbi:MAG: glycosyltransferase [Acidobacteriota bacterium]|nr:glycosyltransferase [Acidobacteriota bacterium]
MEVLTLITGFILGLGVFSFLEGCHSLKQGIRYFRFVQKFCGRSPGVFTPPVTLILPCKGIDMGFKENLSAYFEMNYPDWQILLVTGDASDPSVAVLEEIRALYPHVTSHVLFSGKAYKRSQKVHNLLHSLDYLRDRDEILAFGDSDIRPTRDWLKHLVSALEDSHVGISTGYRWYLPQDGSCASVLRSVWNAGIASLMNEQNCRFAWGGAMSIRREIFQKCHVIDFWQNTLSDDYSISRAIHKYFLTIRFQPPCLSFSHENCSMKQLLDWSARQLSITRIYDPGLWKVALLFHVLNFLTLWGGGLIVTTSLWSGVFYMSDTHRILGITIVLVYLLGCVKGWIRYSAVSSLFPQHAAALHKYRWAYVFLGPLASLITLWGMVCSLVSREIKWRGIRYRMVSPEETIIID